MIKVRKEDFMAEFSEAIQTILTIQNYLDAVCMNLQEAETNPEILLTDSKLTFDADKQYILANIAAVFGEDGLFNFYQQYYEKVISVLCMKIPIQDVKLSIEIIEDYCVILATINNEPSFIINPFAKIIVLAEDTTRTVILNEIKKSEALIAELENEINIISTQDTNTVFNTKKAKEQKQAKINALIAQTGLEKHNLAALNSDLLEYDLNTANDFHIRDQYIQRLQKYYDFKVANLGQHTP